MSLNEALGTDKKWIGRVGKPGVSFRANGPEILNVLITIEDCFADDWIDSDNPLEWPP